MSKKHSNYFLRLIQLIQPTYSAYPRFDELVCVKLLPFNIYVPIEGATGDLHIIPCVKARANPVNLH